MLYAPLINPNLFDIEFLRKIPELKEILKTKADAPALAPGFRGYIDNNGTDGEFGTFEPNIANFEHPLDVLAKNKPQLYLGHVNIPKWFIEMFAYENHGLVGDINYGLKEIHFFTSCDWANNNNINSAIMNKYSTYRLANDANHVLIPKCKVRLEFDLFYDKAFCEHQNKEADFYFFGEPQSFNIDATRPLSFKRAPFPRAMHPVMSYFDNTNDRIFQFYSDCFSFSPYYFTEANCDVTTK